MRTAVLQRLAARCIAVLVLTVAALAGVSSPALAETGGYPYAAYNGPGSNASQSLWTDAGGGRYSPYSYVYRNCTDYAAWKLVSLGVPLDKVRNLGNAKNWAANALCRHKGMGRQA